MWASKKQIGLISKTTLHVHHAFLYISLPSLHDYHVKMPSFTFYGGRKQARTKFSGIFFLFPNLDKLLDKALCEFSWNSTLGEFAYIWQSERAKIIEMKFEKASINLFLSCCHRPPSILNRVPNRSQMTPKCSKNKQVLLSRPTATWN